MTQGELCRQNLFIYKRTKKNLSNKKVPKHHERQETKALKNPIFKRFSWMKICAKNQKHKTEEKQFINFYDFMHFSLDT